MKRHPDGTFRGVRQAVKLSEVSIRARWVEAETLKLKRIGVSYEDMAAHITQVGRGLKPSQTTWPEGLATDPGYSISRQAVQKALKKALSREPALNVDEWRKLNSERCEELWMHLQSGIRAKKNKAISNGRQVLDLSSKINGCYQPTKTEDAPTRPAEAPSMLRLLEAIRPIPDDEVGSEGAV